MTTKVVKFEILKIIGEKNKLMNKLLKDLQEESRHIGNEIIKCLYEESRFGKSILLNSPSYSQKSLAGKIYHELRSVYYKPNPSGLDAILQKVSSEWKTNQKSFNKGESRILSYSNSNAPLYVKPVQIKIRNEGSKYYVKINLISKEYAEELEKGITVTVKIGKKKKEITYIKENKGIGIEFLIEAKDKYQKVIIDRIMSGEYKLGTSQFLYSDRKKKWFLNLVYTFTPEKKELDPNRVMGIDLGLNIPAMLAINDSSNYKQSIGDRSEIENFRKQIESRRRRLQKQRKWCGEGSIGHGRKARLKALKKIGDKIARYKDTKNHCWSREIINEAIRNNCGVIQMEDLSGISEQHTFLNTWSYYDLQQKIKYKAEEAGIQVEIIKPAHTSARCHKCGFIHSKKNKEEWRPSKQQKFICQSCGYETDPDWNAAKNIAIPGIENIIKKQLEKQDRELKHNLKYDI